MYGGMVIDVFTLSLAAVMVSHYVADFLMQSQWQATNKSHNIGALTQHIYIYTLTMMLMLSSLSFLFQLSIVSLITYVLLNGALHFGTDYVTSKLSKRAFKENNIPKFWAIIGADQMAHNLCLLLTMPILML